MPEDDDGAEAEPGALLEAGAHEPGPDALALMLRDDGHRREAHNLQRGMTGKRHGRKQDVADDGCAPSPRPARRSAAPVRAGGPQEWLRRASRTLWR